MDVPNQQVLQTIALDFLNTNLPLGSTIEATSAIVTKQTLSGGQRLLRRQLQEESKLEVDMTVQGTQDPQAEDEIPFGTVASNVFTENEEALQDKLGDASSFFRAEFASAAALDRAIGINGAEGNNTAAGDNVGLDAAMIAMIVVGALSVVIAAALFMKYRSQVEYEDPEPPVDLLSWSTTSPTSVEGRDVIGFAPAREVSSPADSEVYANVADGIEAYSADKDERYASTLPPIDEGTHVKLEECDIETPRNQNTTSQKTPKGTKFVQMDFDAAKIAKMRRKQSLIKADKTRGILGDLESMEDEWEGQLDSKVNNVAQTPRQNNLGKFNRGTRDSASPRSRTSGESSNRQDCAESF